MTTDVKVEQIDRDAANALMLGPLVAGGDGGTYIVRTPVLSEVYQAFARHRLAERAAIVAWLRDDSADPQSLWAIHTAVRHYAAAAIEQGQHLQGDGR